KSQSATGGWAAGGWAPVLQSSLMNSSLEMAQVAARPVDSSVLTKSREFQKEQVDEVSKRVESGGAAGVELYTLSSNLRATASQAQAASDTIEQAKKEGKLQAESRVTAENLVMAGMTRAKAEEFE